MNPQSKFQAFLATFQRLRLFGLQYNNTVQRAHFSRSTIQNSGNSRHHFEANYLTTGTDPPPQTRGLQNARLSEVPRQKYQTFCGKVDHCHHSQGFALVHNDDQLLSHQTARTLSCRTTGAPPLGHRFLHILIFSCFDVHCALCPENRHLSRRLQPPSRCFLT